VFPKTRPQLSPDRRISFTLRAVHRPQATASRRRRSAGAVRAARRADPGRGRRRRPAPPGSTFTEQNTLRAYSSPERHSPDSREYVFLCRGHATLGVSACVPMIPRDKTKAFFVGTHVLAGVPLARLEKLKTAICPLPYLIAAPPSLGKSATAPTLTHSGSGLLGAGGAGRGRFPLARNRLDLVQRSAVLGPVGRPVLPSLGDDLDARLRLVGIDELPELPAALRIADDLVHSQR